MDPKVIVRKDSGVPVNTEPCQSAEALMMIRPVRFGFNCETAGDDVFQHQSELTNEELQAKALIEFNNYVNTLRSKGITVYDFDDTYEPFTPDSIFPNNWVSFHHDGTVVLYPMEAEDRREERREDIINALDLRHGLHIQRIIDISASEEEGRFLEGTGSIVFDYINKIAYACISRRTDLVVLNKLCKILGYKVHTFQEVDQRGVAIYHTNVIMCLGTEFAMLWTEGITNEKVKQDLIKSLEETGHEVIHLTYDQICNFAGNCLELKNKEGKKFLVMAQAGADSLKEDQKKTIAKYAELLPVPLDIIETVEGGSARCMIADVRLPKRDMGDFSKDKSLENTAI